MATMTGPRGTDPGLTTSRMFAEVLQAYLECSEEVQEVIRDMAAIVNDPDATPDEQAMACATISEALFPWRYDGHLGVDLEDEERSAAEHGKDSEPVYADMNKQEKHFSERVQAIMTERGMTQADLAKACGIGQPAVSNLLSRGSRPQRRTVEKIAGALGVTPSEIWPESAEGR
jgi:lambda repressor-like predicted transcriptional regulator